MRQNSSKTPFFEPPSPWRRLSASARTPRSVPESAFGIMRAIASSGFFFVPERSNEAKLVDQIESHINKIIELGFLRRLKVSAGPPSYEVRRILKAFVDAQWLAEFDARLTGYRQQLSERTLGRAGNEDSESAHAG